MKKQRRLGKKLEDFDRKDRKDQDWDPGRLDFTDYAPDPILEDEFFGGFQKSDSDVKWHYERPRRRKGAPKGVPGCEWRRVDGWGWGLFALRSSTPVVKPRMAQSSWNRIWRNGDGLPKRWAYELPSNGPHPFVLQAVRQAEQSLPEVDPERDRAEELDRLAQRPADPPFTPQGILHAERAHFYAQATERRIQKLLYRGFKPSKKLELNRMPKLKQVQASPRLTNAYLAHTPAETRNEHRALLARFGVDGGTPLEVCVAIHPGARVTIIPAEKTAAQLKPKKMGRPTIGDLAMTAAERKRRSRANSKTLPTQKRINPGAVVPPSLRPAVPGPISMDGDEMSAQQFQTILARLDGLGELLAKLLREIEKGSDYHLTAEEFQTVATAASLGRKH